MENSVETPRVKVKTSKSAVDAKTQFVEIKGRKIAYRAVGKGKPFILCNRFRGILDTWDPAFLDAVAQDFTVITFDYTGFGLSTGTPPTDIMSFAMDAMDLVEAFGFDKVVLGGWSFGGLVAQVVVTHYPEIVSHGILIGTGPAGKTEFPIESGAG